jgi:hypothetical protein
MRLFFAISLVSFGALFWAVLAVARHLRTRREPASRPRQQRPMMEIFESGEVRSPRASRLVRKLVQDVAQEGLQTPQQSRQGLFTERSSLSPRAADPNSPPREPASVPRPMLLKSAASVRPQQTIFVERRKAPQSVRPAGIEHRADWALYNKDLGDLTDPYTQQPLRSATASGSSSLNRS